MLCNRARKKTRDKEEEEKKINFVFIWCAFLLSSLFRPSVFHFTVVFCYLVAFIFECGRDVMICHLYSSFENLTIGLELVSVSCKPIKWVAIQMIRSYFAFCLVSKAKYYFIILSLFDRFHWLNHRQKCLSISFWWGSARHRVKAAQFTVIIDFITFQPFITDFHALNDTNKILSVLENRRPCEMCYMIKWKAK